MGWRGTVRSFGAAMRAAERDARRRERQRLEQERYEAKLESLAAAQDAADSYHELLALLTGSHRVTFKRTDWQAIANRPVPAPPVRSSDAEEAAKAVLASYKPGHFAEFFGIAKHKREKLERAVVHGRAADAADYDAAVENARLEREHIELAQRLVALEPDTVAEVIGEKSQIGSTGCVEAATLRFTDDGRIIFFVDGLDIEDMPTQSVTLLSSGKASVKPLSAAKVREIHRDNICSTALRVAAEFLEHIPAEQVEVVVETDLLDPATGRIEAQPVLHVRVAAQAMSAMELNRVEPMAAVERLGGQMKWSSRAGFGRVDLNALDIPVHSS